MFMMYVLLLYVVVIVCYMFLLYGFAMLLIQVFATLSCYFFVTVVVNSAIQNTYDAIVFCDCCVLYVFAIVFATLFGILCFATLIVILLVFAWNLRVCVFLCNY